MYRIAAPLCLSVHILLAGCQSDIGVSEMTVEDQSAFDAESTSVREAEPFEPLDWGNPPGEPNKPAPFKLGAQRFLFFIWFHGLIRQPVCRPVQRQVQDVP